MRGGRAAGQRQAEEPALLGVLASLARLVGLVSFRSGDAAVTVVALVQQGDQLMALVFSNEIILGMERTLCTGDIGWQPERDPRNPSAQAVAQGKLLLSLERLVTYFPVV